MELAKVLVSIPKYFKTWEMLLLHPADFVALSMQEKRVSYWNAFAFFAPTVVFTTYLGAAFTYLFVWLLDPMQPFDVKGLFSLDSAGTLPALAGLMIETLLLYAVLNNWFGHKLAIKTTTPFGRIFSELTYINSPVLLINSLLIFICFIAASAFGIGVVAAISQFGDDWPDVVGWIVIGVALVCFLIIFIGPAWMVKMYYYAILLTKLFAVSRKRAIIVVAIVSPVAFAPATLYTLWGSIIIPSQLSNAESEAAQTVKALASLIQDYSQSFNKELTLHELREFVGSKPDNDIWRLVHSRQFAHVMALDAQDSAAGYKFYVQKGRHNGYINAIPIHYGDNTKYSFVGDTSRVCAVDRRGGGALFSDKTVVLIGD